MRNLPPDIDALKRIKARLDKLMSDRGTPIEVRSTALYAYSIGDEHLKTIFPDHKSFNHFLRIQHAKDILKQIIPNYRVDTSNYKHYQWYFYKETHKNLGEGKGVETRASQLTYHKMFLKSIASDGNKFRSDQEVEIYERLLQCNYLTIEYEARIPVDGEKKFVDFKILNRQTQKTYLWEHFGMTQSAKYLDSMTEKIEWYKKNGYKTVEFGGDLIYTIYSDLKKFQRDIDHYIGVIIK